MTARLFAAMFAIAFASPALAQNCPNGRCPITPVRSAVAAVAQAAPVRRVAVASVRVAVAPVRYAAYRVRVREFRPLQRMAHRMVHRLRCR
jgi:hypothetical protein